MPWSLTASSSTGPQSRPLANIDDEEEEHVVNLDNLFDDVPGEISEKKKSVADVLREMRAK